MDNPDLKRLFVAVPFVPDGGFADKMPMLRGCTCRTDRVNWVEPELLHITLKFLGETSVQRIPLLCKTLGSVAASASAFSFTLNKLGVFGSRYQPRVVWLGPESTPSGMLFLQQSIERALGMAGFPRTFGRFVCHLTLARINHVDDKRFFWQRIDSCRNFFSVHAEVREMVLFESVLNKGYQPQYFPLEHFVLRTDQR